MPRRVSPKYAWFLLLTPTLLGFDLWTKDVAVDALADGRVHPSPLPLLSWVHAENPGAAFSTAIPMPVLVTVGIIAVGVMLHMLWKLPARDRVSSAGLGMLTAGALGNLLDRIGDGTVTDFVRLSAEHTALAPWLRDTFGTSTWPIFNVADVLLLAGLGVLAVGGVRVAEQLE